MAACKHFLSPFQFSLEFPLVLPGRTPLAQKYSSASLHVQHIWDLQHRFSIILLGLGLWWHCPHIVTKGFRLLNVFIFAYFRCLILCWGRSFWQLCHVGLCCLKYDVLLSCEHQTCICYSSLQHFCWCVGSSENFSKGLGIFFGLPDLASTLTVPMMFRFLIMFLTVWNIVTRNLCDQKHT